MIEGAVGRTMNEPLLLHGDCLAVLPTLEEGSVDAVATSPPYAEQRKSTYGGIPEKDYPDWTVRWMDAVPLAQHGSILLNIKEHRNPDGMSDYVHKTRLAVRAAGWNEVDELLWVKPDGTPTGPNALPRRSWERILWFSRQPTPFCNAKDATRTCGRGFLSLTSWERRSLGPARNGTAKTPAHPRKLNYFLLSVRANTNGVGHPAAFPVKLARWMVDLVCPENGTVLDPFMGSGTTGVACVRTGRSFVGVELDEAYYQIARRRIEAARAEHPLFAEAQ